MPKKDKEGLKDLPLEELILDKARGKYGLVLLASQWAKEIKKMEEWRHLTQIELIEKALHDAISGEITWQKIKNMHARAGDADEAPKAKKEE